MLASRNLIRFCALVLTLLSASVHSQMAETQSQVAFLLLTRGDFHHPKIWQECMQQAPFRLYVHAKEDVSQTWLSPYVIAERCATTWLHTIVAQRALLREAIKDSRNTHFVLVSESCVPIRPAREIYDLISGSRGSHIQYGRPGGTGANPKGITTLPAEHRWQNSQWFTLTRAHAELMAQDDSIIALVARKPADNEYYPGSFLSMLGKLHEVENDSHTFVDWERACGPHPYEFSSANQSDYEILLQARRHPNHGALFARKFSASFPESLIRRLQRNEDWAEETEVQ